MALLKIIELQSGVVANYHKIDIVTIKHDFNRNTKMFQVEVSRYKDSASRQSGKNKIDTILFYLDVDFSYSHLDMRSAIYNKLKLIEYFTGATSDILI